VINEFRQSKIIQITFVVSITISLYAIYLFEQYNYQKNRSSVQKIASSYVSHIRKDINQALSATYPIAALIRTQHGDAAGFNELASEMLSLYPGIFELELQPDGIIKHVVPLKGNEGVIGHNILLNPERTKEAFLARDTGKLTLAGPFNLVQGGIGAVARHPIYLDSEEGQTFWGFASVLIRFPDILNATKLPTLLNEGIAYQLSRIHPDTGDTQVIASSNTPLIDSPETFDIEVPNSVWTFQAFPVNGWRDNVSLALSGLMGILITFLMTFSALLISRLSNNKQHLELTVIERTKALEENIGNLVDSESRLSESKERYERAVNGANDGIWEWTLATGEYYLSLRWKQLLGYKDHELSNVVASFDDHIHPDDSLRVEEAFQAHFEERKPYEVEFRLSHKSGEYRWFNSRGQATRDENGQPVIMSGSITDITERKQIEKSVAEKEEQLLSFYKSDIVGLAITSPDKGWLRINNCLCVMLGYSEEALRSMTWTELTHPDDLAADVEQFSRLLANDIDTYGLEKRFISRTGKIIPTNLVVNCVRKPDGQVDYVTAMVQDITERKLSEHQLSIAATAFESQEGMMVTDANSVILRVNKAFTTITGYNVEEVLGKKPNILSSGQHDALFYDAMWKDINTTGYWEGEVWNKRKDGDVYPEKLTITAVKNLNGNVTNYVATITDISLSKQAEQKIEDLAYFDPLTHLPNRRLMIDRIKHAMAVSARSGKEGALLFLDLDHFKMLNDTLGHDMGDLLLQQVAERLTSCIREGDTVSRFGGDEFVVLLEGLSSHSIEAASQVEDIADKILSTINLPYQLVSHHYTSSTSIGITVFDDHQSDVEELLKQADIAMYQAKDDGRNTLRFFDPQMQESINERTTLEKALIQAVEQQQFQLYYQVQVDDSLHPLGAEALIRWNHPERGLVSPIDFIPVAEISGAILTIGQWVLDAACAQLKLWQQDTLTRDLNLSVNVSAKQFHQADFVSQVMMTIQQHAINPARLKLELTESILLDDIEVTITKMKTLAESGIQFSLDDFGTGYSSLQYLKRLPLDQLKIDKSFVDDLVTDSNDQVIVRTIISMAYSLGLSVIAEGVETKEQQQLLLEEVCMQYQGYLYSKPVPIDEFEALLKKG